MNVWLGAFLTITLLSMVFFKDNPVYNTVVHIFIGLGAGHVIVMGLNVIKNSGWMPLIQKGQYNVLIPMILGLLLFSRFSKKYSYLGKPSVALIVAVAAGLGLRGAIIAQFLDQIRATFVPLTSVSNLILAAGVLSTLLYFFFAKFYTSKLTGPLRYLPYFGRYVMMVCFGASFASAGAGFLSKLITRIMFLARDWLGLI